MKTLAIILLFLLALNAPVKGGENGAKTKDEWIAVITKDAKLSSLTAFLGLPDWKKANPANTELEYHWYYKVDIGTKNARDLMVLAKSYKGELIIWAIYDPATEQSIRFPWAGKVLDEH